MELEGYAEEVQPVGETSEEHSKVKILLVDDTPENLVALEAALYGLGEESGAGHILAARRYGICRRVNSQRFFSTSRCPIWTVSKPLN